MPSVFVTGGAGFIGSKVVRQFVDAGYEVFVFDTFKQYLIPEPRAEQHNLLVRLADIWDSITLVQGDTLNKDFLRRSLDRAKPDIIVHMAALPLASVAIEQTEEAFNSILDSTLNILEVVRDFDRPCTVIYTSSSMVYGDFLEGQVNEDSVKDPKEIYGSMKLAGEFIARGYMKRYDLDVRIVRPTAVYGPYDGNQRVLYKFISGALAGKTLTVDGDGSTRLDFTHVDDTARGIYLVATHPGGAGETFNIARGRSRSLTDAIDTIKQHVDDVKVEFRPTPDYMPDRGTLDVTKARTMLGFDPQYDLENGLPPYIEHLRSNRI